MIRVSETLVRVVTPAGTRLIELPVAVEREPLVESCANVTWAAEHGESIEWARAMRWCPCVECAKAYPSLAAYMADVEAARSAYYADEAVRAGFCADCKTRKKDGAHRSCWSCRHTT